MADPITQANRLLEITTPAGTDVLLLDGFTGHEAMSRPFRFELNLVSEVAAGTPAQVDPHALVGQLFTITVTMEDDQERYFNGYCERFSKGKQDDQFAYYTATIVPWFQLLTYTSNCRIFQKKAVPDIISQVVGDMGYSANIDTSGLTRTYTSWDYCVQYRESDFAFISRLMEAEGIYYYFQHDDGSHKMMLGDAPSSYKNLPNQSSFKYSPATGIEDLEDTIRVWSSEERLYPGKWRLRDYHHEMPSSTLETTEQTQAGVSQVSSSEIYDYPGGYAKKFNDPAARVGNIRPEGETLVEFGVTSEEATRVEVTGGSVGRAFTSGYKIKVTGGDAAGTYLLTEVMHQATQAPDYHNRDDIPAPYTNNFKCVDATLPFTPAVSTPKPVVSGLQTALVVDEGSGEEIWPDKYGRVRVQFPWDLEAKFACWLRVVQPWAGKSWGHQWIPRVGDEVAVSCMDGDPDCPIVVGSMYNSVNMPMFTLPDNKTQSGFQTHSSKGGGGSDYNMMRLEDKNGSEEIFVQAQKDLNTVVKHDETRKVGNNRTTNIHVDDTRTVETGNDKIEVQKGNRSITVDQGNITVEVTAGKHTRTVMGDITEEAKQGNITTTADMGNIATEAKLGNISTKADVGNISVTASIGNITEQADLGNITIQAALGKVTISGLQGVTISCGASSIEMTPASISISAPIVMINS